MNIVFFSGQNLNFEPVLEKPIPPELFRTDSPSLFDRNLEQWRHAFPDADFLVIDTNRAPAYYEHVLDLDVLNLPAVSLHARLFLFASFALSMELSPLTLFVPAGMTAGRFDVLAQAVRFCTRNDLSNSGLTLFCDDAPAAAPMGVYYEPGSVLHKDRIYELESLKAFVTGLEADRRRASKENFRFYAHNGIILAHLQNWAEALFQKDEETHGLFYNLQNAWQDGKSINTVIRDIAAHLDTRAPDVLRTPRPDLYLVKAGTRVDTVSGMRGLLQSLPADKNGNYVSGSAVLNNVSSSFIITDSNDVRISGLNGIYYYQKGPRVRTGRLDNLAQEV